MYLNLLFLYSENDVGMRNERIGCAAFACLQFLICWHSKHKAQHFILDLFPFCLRSIFFSFIYIRFWSYSLFSYFEYNKWSACRLYWLVHNRRSVNINGNVDRIKSQLNHILHSRLLWMCICLNICFVKKLKLIFQ